MNKKMSILLMVFIILFSLVGCNASKQQIYEVYGMNEDIQLIGMEGEEGERIFKTYVRPVIGNQELDSILEVTIITSDKIENL